MKRKSILYLTCLLLIIGIVGAILYFILSTPASATLFINGKEITNVSAKIRYADSVLPFTEVLKGFGFKVTWRDNNIANVTYEGKTYILNLENATLTEEGFDDDLLICPPGNRNGYCKAEGRELFIDENTIFCTMSDFGKIIDINTDRDKLMVYVAERKE